MASTARYSTTETRRSFLKLAVGFLGGSGLRCAQGVGMFGLPLSDTEKLLRFAEDRQYESRSGAILEQTVDLRDLTGFPEKVSGVETYAVPDGPLHGWYAVGSGGELSRLDRDDAGTLARGLYTSDSTVALRQTHVFGALVQSLCGRHDTRSGLAVFTATPFLRRAGYDPNRRVGVTASRYLGHTDLGSGRSGPVALSGGPHAQDPCVCVPLSDLEFAPLMTGDERGLVRVARERGNGDCLEETLIPTASFDRPTLTRCYQQVEGRADWMVPDETGVPKFTRCRKLSLWLLRPCPGPSSAWQYHLQAAIDECGRVLDITFISGQFFPDRFAEDYPVLAHVLGRTVPGLSVTAIA
jgi:hypothetical protein